MLLASTIRLPHGRLTTASDPMSSTSGQLTGGYSSSKHSESPRITGCAPRWGTGAHLTGAEGGMGLRATLLSPVLAPFWKERDPVSVLWFAQLLFFPAQWAHDGPSHWG